MARNFRGIWKSLVPRWLNDGEGGLVGYVLMLLNDATLQRLYLGHLARFPMQGPDGTPGPDDALAALGRDRGVVRGIDETSRSYAYRLTQWLVYARKLGSAFGLLRTLHSYVDFDGSKGCSFRVVDSRGNWFSRASDGTESYLLKQENWDWDGEGATRWARFWVIIYPGTRWTESPYAWGDTGPGWGEYTTTTLGATITAEQVAVLRSIVDEWKPAGTRCKNIILAFDPDSFDPATTPLDGLWGSWSKVVGGVRVRSRLSTARYLKGT